MRQIHKVLFTRRMDTKCWVYWAAFGSVCSHVAVHGEETKPRMIAIISFYVVLPAPLLLCSPFLIQSWKKQKGKLWKWLAQTRTCCFPLKKTQSVRRTWGLYWGSEHSRLIFAVYLGFMFAQFPSRQEMILSFLTAQNVIFGKHVKTKGAKSGVYTRRYTLKYYRWIESSAFKCLPWTMWHLIKHPKLQIEEIYIQLRADTKVFIFLKP